MRRRMGGVSWGDLSWARWSVPQSGSSEVSEDQHRLIVRLVTLCSDRFISIHDRRPSGIVALSSSFVAERDGRRSHPSYDAQQGFVRSSLGPHGRPDADRGGCGTGC